MENLAQKRCIPCEVGSGTLSEKLIHEYIKNVKNWELGEHSISKKFYFKDFNESMAFVNEIAKIAEKEGHHPDIFISYHKVTLTLMTHAVHGLTVNDFILAAKVDEVKE